MSDLGSTRVFGRHAGGGGVVTIGLPRRPMRDLYHGLVTGSWTRLFAAFAVVYFATQALFGLGRLLLAADLPAGGPVVASLGSALQATPAAPAPPLSAGALAAAVFGAVGRFVHWVEIVLGASIVIAKFSLVRARVLFSKVAVIAPHEGGRALMLRMANERTSHIVDARVSVMLVRYETQDGEVLQRAHDLALTRRASPLFSHAWTAIHPIDRASPLAGESAGSLQDAEAEIIVNLSGFDEGLMRTVHACHVYPAERVRWNVRFREIVGSLPDGRNAVDYRKFHETTPVDDPPGDRTPARRARQGP
jgi:inward rectifier potassium channel